jgi:hypothetical protein
MALWLKMRIALFLINLKKSSRDFLEGKEKERK